MTNESIECPLCMETMDFDDVDFYPCPCRYQICRFCWDKIINEENGLCPACRKPYNSENPASYKPRTDEEIKNKIKHSKKVCPKKVKPTQDGKEYLSEYRVLQKNLIFVVGLPMRMAEEVELLKGLEYFGRCGKVYKIVINQNQTFPGPQGTPCLSAYVTYHRNDDALKTLVDLKKLEIDGRAVKLSLGTTKYCSQFLRNRRCTKQDCMYLHEMGEQAASFTKEDMANGKHTEYENQLIQEFFDTYKNTLSNLSSSPSSSLSEQQQDKTIQRKSSLSSSSHIITMTTTTTTSSPCCSSSRSQQGGYNCHITPIGTDPNDATKIYSMSSSSSSPPSLLVIDNNNYNSKLIINKSLSTTQESSHDIPLNCDLLINNNNNNNNQHQQSIITSTLPSDLPIFINDQIINNDITTNSLLDNFYYLNSQSSSDNKQNNTVINQQINNNYLQFPYKSDIIDFSRSFNNHYHNNEQKIKIDTADIDFDPINISRLGLAELIANENRQKVSNNYNPPPLLPPPPPPPLLSSSLSSSQNRGGILRTPHDFLNQSNSDYYNSRDQSLSSSTSSYLLDKQLRESNGGNSAAVVPINSGFPSPPPGFEVTHHHHHQHQHHLNPLQQQQQQQHHHHNHGGAEQPINEMVNVMLMNHNNSDIYNPRYPQSQHSEIPLNISQQHHQQQLHNHSSQYNHQYSVPSGNSYHNDYSGFSNSGNGGMMASFNNDINSQQWKTAQSVFCDVSMPQDIQQQHSLAVQRSSAYHRSHSMNENQSSNITASSALVRGSHWSCNGGFNNNDSHMNNFTEGSFLLPPMIRGQSVQCSPATTSGNDPQLYVRQQTSHSVNH